ncbi:hypothetical protein ACQEU5_03710 [Marinactinospora thermotolerans]|uniref:hypothetical protein n=1 Tax=Marinactinospora thermotolerans TaxID=531310 RepID=UPI003D91C58D
MTAEYGGERPGPAPAVDPSVSVAADIGEVRGAAHTGSGDQYNTHLHLGSVYEIDERGRLRRRVRTRLITDEQVRRLDRCFVEGPGYAKARDVLGGDEHSVIVTAEPGSGRRAAAMMLLHRLADRDVDSRFRELPDDAVHNSVDPGILLDERNLQRGDRLLLDLTGPAGRGLLEQVQPVLEGYRHAVQRHRARLVVVLPRDQEEALYQDFRALVVHLERPDGREVLRGHLDLHAIPFTETDLHRSGVQEWAAGAAPGEIAELVRMVETARQAPGAGSLAGCLAQARIALSDRGVHAAEQIDKTTDVRERALLLAAAMFDGFRGDVVFAAAELLGRELRLPDPETPYLERSRLGRRFDELGIRVGPDRTVTFERLGHAEALRNRFWDDYPELGQPFRTWIGACMRGLEITGAQRDELAGRFAAQCLRTGRIRELFAQVEAWCRGERGGRVSLSPQAVFLLNQALADGSAAREVRQQVRVWASRPSLPPALAHVLIMVSADAIASGWPDEAVVRLHHLARHEDPGVREDATEELLRVASRPWSRRLLLNRVVDGLGRRTWKADLALLTPVADPARLQGTYRGRPFVADPQVRADLTAGLAALFGKKGEETIRHHARRWLDACAAGEAPRDLLELLAEAAHRTGRSNRLYAAVREWTLRTAEGTPERKIALGLFRRIDEYQGLRPRGTGPGEKEWRTP